VKSALSLSKTLQLIISNAALYYAVSSNFPPSCLGLHAWSLPLLVSCDAGHHPRAAGGNGAPGGSVLLRATRQLTGLGSIPLHVEAERGGHGGKQWMDGKKGVDKVRAVAKLWITGLTVLGQASSSTCLSASC